MFMFYALFLEGGLHGAGVRWLNYPANIITIIFVTNFFSKPLSIVALG